MNWIHLNNFVRKMKLCGGEGSRGTPKLCMDVCLTPEVVGVYQHFKAKTVKYVDVEGFPQFVKF